MMTEAQTKACTKCRKVKPVGEFYAAKRCVLGLRPECKSCSNDYHNRWARQRYVPKTGRRYLTKGDREESAAAPEPDAAP